MFKDGWHLNIPTNDFKELLGMDSREHDTVDCVTKHFSYITVWDLIQNYLYLDYHCNYPIIVTFPTVV
jgi:hypothetical protein